MAKKVTIYAGVTNAAYVAITAHSFTRRAKIYEDGSGAAAGLVVQFPDGTVAEYPPSQQPILFDNPGGGAGAFVGVPAQASNYPGGTGPAATQYCQVKSMGANTAVRLEEDN